MTLGTNGGDINVTYINFLRRNCIWLSHLKNSDHFVSAIVWWSSIRRSSVRGPSSRQNFVKMTTFLFQRFDSSIIQFCRLGFTTFRPKQNGRHFAGDIFNGISSNENLRIKKKSLKYVSWGLNRQFSSIGSDNGLAPNRRQAVIWTSVGMFYGRIYVSLGLNELISSNVDEMDWRLLPGARLAQVTMPKCISLS